MTTNLDVINSVPRVATLIYQTHQLWQEFRGVSDGISGLVEHLKALEPIFAEIEDHFNEDNVSASFKNCLDMSKKAHDSLGVLVADMRTQLQAKKSIKRKYATVKIMLNKSVVERLEQSMSRCMTFLQLAIQAYQMAMLRKLSSQVPAARVQPQRHTLVRSSRQSLPLLLQDKKMPQFQNDVDEFFPRSKKTMERSNKTTNLLTFDISQYARFALTYTNGAGGWKAQLQLPSWISTSVYEFISAPAIAGWTYSYRVYNIIADDSELIRKISCGDLIGVRQMFSSRNASPFDRTSDGRSLLHYAATNQQYEICQLLLQLGLVSLLDYTSGNTSPIDSIASKMFSIQNAPPEKNLQMIAELFASYLQEPDSLPAERLLDFIRSFAPDDKLLHHFRNLFMPKYYLRPLKDRLEAVRLGAFNVIDCRTLKGLLSEDRNITKNSVAQSSCEKASLVHSVALAMGCRYPERLNKCMKPHVWMRTYDEYWAQLVVKTAQFATLEDLTCVETVVPWDAYEVTAWRGTPLSSVIGGALCYLCPDTPVNHWDAYFNGCLQQWLTLLESAGVDLLAYGKRELLVLHDIENNTKGAFDADAIESSRSMLRHHMRKGEPLPKVNRITRTDMSGEQYWVPLRMIDLDIGPSPGDWKLNWAPEYEFMACQFWRTIENKKEVIMPGAWVDCQDDY